MTHDWNSNTKAPARRSLTRVASAAPVLAILAAASCAVTDESARSSSQPLSVAPAHAQADARGAEQTLPSLGVVSKLREQFRVSPGKPLGRPKLTPKAQPTIGASLASTIEVGDRLTPTFTSKARGTTKHPAIVSYASKATGGFRVVDQQSGMQVEAKLLGTIDAPAALDEGYVIYRGAWGAGDVVHRPSPGGNEDFVTIAAETDPGAMRYSIAIDSHVKGLRLVANTLELVDETGHPRVRMSPPYLVDSAGKRQFAKVSVEGCAVDTNAAPPWKHAVVAPNGTACTVVIRWDRKSIAYPALVDPSWTTAGSLATARFGHVAVTYSDGTVVAAGGLDTNYLVVSAAEVYDPNTDTWAATGSTLDGVQGATAHLVNHNQLPQVLVVGGATDVAFLGKSEVWDSNSGTWAYTAGDLNTARAFHSSAQLSLNSVVVGLGYDTPSSTTTSAELYDATTETWSVVGSLGTSRANAAATVLSNGKALFVGGNDVTATTVYPTAELYDPNAQTWSAAADMTAQHASPSIGALANGKAIVAAGIVVNAQDFGVAETYDPNANTWTATSGAMTDPSFYGAGAILPSGKFLTAGGYNQLANAPALVADVYDPATDKWTASGTIPGGTRENATASVLFNKKTLIVGGTDSNVALTSTALFDMGTSGDVCSANSDCTSGFCVDGVCCNSACGGGNANDCQACSVAAGGSVDGTCGFVGANFVCKTAGTTCESNAICLGNSNACPTPPVKAQGTVCNASSGVCENDAVCDGSTNACPAKTEKSAATVCNAAGGACENDAKCDGVNPSCPAKTLVSAGSVCAAASGSCENAAKCDGVNVACPAKTFVNAGSVCNPAAGPCENDAKCDGSTAACPAKVPVAAATVCNPAAGPCESSAACDGVNAACPAKVPVAANTVCNPASGSCENDAKCDGATAACPAKTFVAANTVCNAASGSCENDAKCDGATAACPNKTFVSQGTICAASSGGCEIDAMCDGASSSCAAKKVLPAGTVCNPSASECQANAVCDGSGTGCPVNANVPDGTSCNNGQGQCVSGQCSALPAPDAGAPDAGPTDDGGSVTPDAGTDGSVDADGGPDASPPSAVAVSTPGCNTAGGNGAPSGSALVIGLALMMVTRRRKSA